MTVEESFETMRQMYQAMRHKQIRDTMARLSRRVEWLAATEKNCTHTMPPVAALRADTWGL
ncbi:MAG: hypothetical protein ACLR8P_03855 [Clostridium fessum]